MSIKQFAQSNNINMLWDIISEENVFQFIDRVQQNNLHDMFLKNISGFYENEKNSIHTLDELNKKYVLLFMNYIKKHKQPNKIKIHYDENNENNKSQFERQFIKKKEEFDELNTLHIPTIPDFADKNTDAPIKELDKILKNMQSQRNYDIEQIRHTYVANNNNNNTNNNNTEPTTKKNKNVSFQEQEPDDDDFNIFSKLKPKVDNSIIELLDIIKKTNQELTTHIHNLEKIILEKL